MYKYPEIENSLEEYKNLILTWNKVHNLISKNSEPFIQERHLQDSLRIFEYIDVNAKIICDFGSGAGFPAIPLALYLNNINSGAKIYLYESRKKKADFLRLCITELNIKNTSVVNDRIEKSSPVNADIITARAFASLKEIFYHSTNFRSDRTKFILHKGEKTSQEIDEAKKFYNFEYELHDKNDQGGVILLASNVKPK